MASHAQALSVRAYSDLIRARIETAALPGRGTDATPPHLIPDGVYESWLRCAESGLSHDTPLDKALEGAQRARPKPETVAIAAQIASADTPLRDALGSDFDLVVLDANGTVAAHYPSGSSPFGNASLQGAVLDEAAIGTTARSAGAGDGIRAVIGAEHFLGDLDRYSSAWFPIGTPAGNAGGILLFAHERDGAMDVERARDALTSLAALLAENVRYLARMESSRTQVDVWKSLYLNIQSYVDTALVTVNARGGIINANDLACNLLGLAPDELSGLPFYQIVECDRELLMRIAQGNAVSGYRVSLKAPRGKVACLLDSRPIVSNNFGHLQGNFIRLSPANPASQDPGSLPRHTFATIISDDAIMREVKNRAVMFATDFTPIVLVGEVGVGKDLFAEAIHNLRHSDGGAPFIAVNCAALHTADVQEKLFGSQSPESSFPGRFEAASGGTLILDNIDDLPKDLQTLFLRVLDKHTLTRTGGQEFHDVRFKLICTAHKDLYELVEQGKFRSDLYYRIAGVVIRIPPLRERVNDIGPIAADLVLERCRQNNLPPITLSERTIRALRAYSWPGNVRELRSAMNYACHVCKRQIIDVDDLPADILGQFSSTGRVLMEPANVVPLADMEREQILGTLQETGGNVAKAAKLLGLGRSTLYKRLKKYNIPY